MHNVEANAGMFVRWMLPSMLAQWLVGSLQKFIPSAIHVAAYCSYYERFQAWHDRSPRIVGSPSVFIICTQASAPSNIALIDCIMRRFLHVWITSPSMVSLSPVGSLGVWTQTFQWMSLHPSMSSLQNFVSCMFVYIPTCTFSNIAMATYTNFRTMNDSSGQLKKICRKCVRSLHSNLYYSIHNVEGTCTMMYRTKISLKCVRHLHSNLHALKYYGQQHNQNASTRTFKSLISLADKYLLMVFAFRLAYPPI